MFVKKFKRKCSVRGCKNTDNVYLVSKRREMGGTIGICTECLKEATKDIAEYTEPIKVVKEKTPLFPHPELEVTLSSVADEEPKPVEVIEEVAEDIPISVTEDTVTIPKEEKPIIEAPKPRTTNNTNKKKPKKK